MIARASQTEPATVACYLRVSSVGQNLAGQRAEIEHWLRGNGLDPESVAWFVDQESGKNLDRPAFDDLQAAIFAGEVKTVVVWKLDRLSRSMRDGINVLHDWCESDVRVVSVTQQLDLSGAVGRMIAAVLLGIGEMERENILERQAAGIAVAKRQGRYRGRKQGATKAKPARAIELRRKGLSFEEIATAMGVSARTVRRYVEAS